MNYHGRVKEFEGWYRGKAIEAKNICERMGIRLEVKDIMGEKLTKMWP